MDDRIRESEYILIRRLNENDFTSISKTAASSLLKNLRFVRGPWIDFAERKQSSFLQLPKKCSGDGI
ncbi:hypothetical protein DLM78_19760 [Leptospira stimsonii]|uniref:Uncharacterized protein n=1 Tax=Leptospira stimsonii TaxID=2202203 RepID=A0A8B3CJL1_9LEPT|nr:hypothetical protein DLM78_19760 [Leptospira stimsonii]